MKKIQNLGFSCRLETINAVEAWRGSLPGDGYRNVRRVLLHTLNLADMLPITAVWAGLRENPSRLMPKKSPPLLFAATTGATPFRVNLHVADLGHTLMCGPSGAGKSTALGLIAAQWFRYPRAQVFAFDKGYSLFVLTKAAGRRVLRSGRGKDGTRLSARFVKSTPTPT
jgi:type IV secretory pathway VirB4 component